MSILVAMAHLPWLDRAQQRGDLCNPAAIPTSPWRSLAEVIPGRLPPPGNPFGIGSP